MHFGRLNTKGNFVPANFSTEFSLEMSHVAKMICILNFRQNGQLLYNGMGVVVQEMVPADVAGVLFTRDPLSGTSAKMFITANYGLGEVCRIQQFSKIFENVQ